MTRSHLLFALMCLIWGLTWIAIKTGVTAVPPIFFAGSRFAVAGVAMLLWLGVTGRKVLPARGDVVRVLLAALFLTAVTYAFLFWGVRSVPSGLAAILNLALTPIGLFAIGLLHGTERWSGRQAAAILLGFVGLALLFWPRLTSAGGGFDAELMGLVAIVAGTLGYCWGSVIGRPLLQRQAPLQMAGLATFVGGMLLLLLALAVEPVTPATLALYLRPEVFVAWAYLIVCGSFVAFTVYLRLLRDWGAARVGMYAFVTPIIAAVTGAAVFGERFGAPELAGMGVLLAATWMSLRRLPPAPAGQGA
jgi:drug/metabolite transporter (DMT)-like permease